MKNETKFPEWRRYENDDGSGWTVMISRLEMDDWFKRCTADFPNLAVVEFHAWFNKWFLQFIEKGEDEND